MNLFTGNIGIVREFDLENVPAQEIIKGSKLAGIYLILFSIIFGGFPLFFLVWSILNDKFEFSLFLIILPFIVISIAVAIYAVNLLIKEEEIVIDYKSVKCRAKSLFKRYEWEEDLSEYEGVLYKNSLQSKNEYEVIELHHNRADRCIALAIYHLNWMGDEEIRQKFEYYSKKLNLPAIEITTEGVEKRSPENLNSPLRDIVKKKNMNFSTLNAIPRGLSKSFENGMDLISIDSKRTLKPATLLLLIFAAVIIYIGLFLKKDPELNFIAVGIFGLALGAYIIIYTIWDILTKQQISCAYDKIHIFTKTPIGKTRGKILYSPTIENIKIDREKAQSLESVIIVSDKMKIKIGEGLPKESLQWIKNFLINKISG